MSAENRTVRTFDFYVLLFFLVSFTGWLWEVGLFLVTRHAWINRGIYKGPYLPIYGVGGLLLWFLLHRLHNKPFLTFLLSAVLCSALEYFTSFFLEWRWGVRWWDYSGYHLDINGRVCLLGAVCFGLGGMALNCYLMPLYMRLYHKISRRTRLILCGVFLGIFLLDITYCAVRPNMGYGISTSGRAYSLPFAPLTI